MSAQILPFPARASAAPYAPSEFSWTDTEWAQVHLPWVRLAAVVAAKSQAECRACMLKLRTDDDGADDGARAADDMLDSLLSTREHLQGLIAMLDGARAQLVAVDIH